MREIKISYKMKNYFYIFVTNVSQQVPCEKKTIANKIL